MTRALTLILISAASAVTLNAGGWAVTTIERVPDFAIVGRPVRIEFTVRQHGHFPSSGLRATVGASVGRTVVSVPARETKQTGRYTAELTLPTPGLWTVVVNGWGAKSMTLPVVVGQGEAPRLTDAERGLRLFGAKGCVTCHRHSAVPTTDSVGYGPELTDRRYPAEVLTAKLRHPVPCETLAPNPCMPVLGIHDDELGPLAAFLGQPARSAAALASMGR